MKRLVIAIALMLMVAAPALFAQSSDRGAVGVYGDYFRYGVPGGTANLYGLGGNIMFNASHNVQVAGEISYDFEQGYNFTSLTNPGLRTVSTRLVHGLVGPELKPMSWHGFRPFVTVKGGFLNFDTVSTTEGITSGFGLGSSTHFALFPGGGVEAFAGHVGVRVELGDFIYWNNGAFNNFRLAVGPQFRF
jgi:hypothetical protein